MRNGLADWIHGAEYCSGRRFGQYDTIWFLQCGLPISFQEREVEHPEKAGVNEVGLREEYTFLPIGDLS
jgi:hypothetical protein